jgi:Fur family ferric uptake transcriptional regulator
MKNLEDTLQSNNIKITEQRKKILKVIFDSEDHPDAEEIYQRVQKVDNTIGLATVYRTIAVLEENNLLERVVFDQDKRARFEIKDVKKHHHHLIDMKNGKIIEFCSEAFEKLKDEIAAQYGYKVIDHRFELYCVEADKD